jgi:hypothetical protein
VIEFDRRPRIESDAGEQQRAGGTSLGPQQIAAEQIDEDEGGGDEELRDEIGRPAHGAGCEPRHFQDPTRHGGVLVGRDHPLAAPHVTLDDIQWETAMRKNRR